MVKKLSVFVYVYIYIYIYRMYLDISCYNICSINNHPCVYSVTVRFLRSSGLTFAVLKPPHASKSAGAKRRKEETQQHKDTTKEKTGALC